LIFEDRKFADIGNTVALQYSAGIYKIVEWADIITINPIPGPGILSGLKSVVGNRERGGLLLLEMSSADNLCTTDYQRETISLAKLHKDFVFGFISMKPMEKELLTLTPGVQFGSKGDKLGQVYRDPRTVVKRGSDVIIVGRGITGAEDIETAAKEYQREGWQGYLDRLQE